MGCINSSSNKLRTELRNENVLRVRVVRLQPNSAAVRNGFLELTQRELIFVAKGDRPVVWSLQHLRRYGLSDDVFSFEAGRRCATGPGIYTFCCQNADQLYQQFQRFVNAVATDENSLFNERDHPSYTYGRPEPNAHSNNYLEPAPLTGSILRASLHDAFNNGSAMNSPDSLPNLPFTNDLEQVQDHPASPANTNAVGNVYLDHPLRAHQEYNNNTASENNYANSEIGTLGRKTMVKRSSLDNPPEECAPLIGVTDELHMYANVEGLGSLGRDGERESAMDASERCYENLSMQLPITSPREQTANGGVNYIVLDLEPRSPVQCSPKASCFGSGFSLAYEKSELAEEQTLSAMPATTSAMTNMKHEETVGSSAAQQQDKTESTLGYSTIDFIKTCALIKSSTHGSDFDHEESRITRHSKCVRKAYSISE